MSLAAAKAVAAVMNRDCLAHKIRQLSRVITGIFDQALRPYDLKISQINIMAVVAARGPAEAEEVSQILNLEKSTLSRNVGRMRAKGWLTLVKRENGRGKALALTEEGARLLVKVFPVWREAQERAAALLGREGAAAVAEIMSVASANSG
ncbi:MAG: MarR family winged helix-turn-helix transcriptional regulator [Thermodesulfobacteriota bacterium]